MSQVLRSRYALSSVVVAAVLGLILVLLGTATTASAAGINQGQVVPEKPRRDLPVALDGRVLAHAQVGDRIFVGGSFTQVRLNDGSVIDQAYIYAYDIDTGELDPNFRPVLNNLVRALEPTQAGDGLYVGGRFSSWDTSFPLRVAKLDAEGNLNTNFAARASARVNEIKEVGNDVYIGGNFLDVSGVAVTGLAKVDRVTGVVDASFTPAFTDSVAGSELVRTMDVTPDGASLFVLHYGSAVNGQVREVIAKFDINGGNPTLSGWNVPWTAQAGRRECADALRDLAISPDGSFLVVGGQGADNPPNCDSVTRYPTGGNGTVNYDWAARMYSSVFSLAVSDVAVYVGGHFCAAPRNPIPPGGISSDNPLTANACDVNNPDAAFNPSVIDPDNAVFRSQMAALNPGNGQALAWDPGSNNDLGVFDLTLIDRGLLAGQDGDRYNQIFVGRSGFFDNSPPGPDTTAPEFEVTSPLAGSVPDGVTQLTGTATDDRTINRVVVQLNNVTTGQWLQPNGSFGDDRADLGPAVTITGIGAVSWSVNVPSLPPGVYEINGFAGDEFGNTSPASQSVFTIAGEAACSVSLNNNDQPRITLTDFVSDSNSNIIIRRNGGWLSTQAPGTTSFTDTAAEPGDYSYVVRWRPDGAAVDVACTPSSITVPPAGGGAPTCSAQVDNGNVVVNWDAVPGEDSYQVRDNDGWVATVSNATSFTDTNPGAGDRNYVIRYRLAGQNFTISCSPSVNVGNGGGGAPGCSAQVDNGNVVVNWDAVPGEDSYQVRDNDGWVATVSNATTFTDTNPGAGDRNYVIRYRMAGQNFEITCSPQVNAG